MEKPDSLPLSTPQSYSYIKWDAITPEEFEKLCQMILGHFGFNNIVRMGGSGDKGRDIICDLKTRLGVGGGTAGESGGIEFTTKWIVQCKHYKESPQKPLLQEDLSKAVEHGPDFWLLMTSATLTPAIYDWLQGAGKSTFKFRILVLDGIEISRIILQKPTLAYMLKDKLFVDDGIIVSELMALMASGRYQDALDRISKLFGKLAPQMAYLEACCRSMIAQLTPKDNTSSKNLEEEAFAALQRALDSGYVAQLYILRGWPKEKVIYEIERDPELKYLREKDLTRFTKILGITKGGTSGKGGCLMAGTPVRLQDGSEKPISSIGAGEVVAVPAGLHAGATVTHTFRFDEDYIITINNTLHCSPSQPLLTTQGWKKAMELDRGDILIRKDTHEPVLSLLHKKENSGKVVQVFMISLSSDHIFYASDYVVHNKMPLWLRDT